MTVDTWTNVSGLLSTRYPSSYFATYREDDYRNEAFEDDGFIHVQKGRYRYVFYLEPQGTLKVVDVPRFQRGVMKAIRSVGRQKEER